MFHFRLFTKLLKDGVVNLYQGEIVINSFFQISIMLIFVLIQPLNLTQKISHTIPRERTIDNYRLNRRNDLRFNKDFQSLIQIY